MIKYQTHGDNLIAIVHNKVNRGKFLITYSKNPEGGYQVAVFRELGWFKYFFGQHEFNPIYLLEVGTENEAREGIKKVAELFENSNPEDVIRKYTKITHSSGASILLDETELKEGMAKYMSNEIDKLSDAIARDNEELILRSKWMSIECIKEARSALKMFYEKFKLIPRDAEVKASLGLQFTIIPLSSFR